VQTGQSRIRPRVQKQRHHSRASHQRVHRGPVFAAGGVWSDAHFSNADDHDHMRQEVWEAMGFEFADEGPRGRTRAQVFWEDILDCDSAFREADARAFRFGTVGGGFTGFDPHSAGHAARGTASWHAFAAGAAPRDEPAVGRCGAPRPPSPSPEVRGHLRSLDIDAMPASIGELRAAYQHAAKRYHPDMVTSGAACAARFQAATRAFHCLRASFSEA
jgi:hypothetical protein